MDENKSRTLQFFKDLNPTIAWSAITFIFSAISSVSFLLGKYTADTQNIELRYEVRELRDQVQQALIREEMLMESIPVQNVEVFYVTTNIPKLLPDLNVSVELEKLQSAKHGNYAAISIKNKDGKKIYSNHLFQNTGELIPKIGILSYLSKSDSSMNNYQHLFPLEDIHSEEGVVLKIEAF